MRNTRFHPRQHIVWIENHCNWSKWIWTNFPVSHANTPLHHKQQRLHNNIEMQAYESMNCSSFNSSHLCFTLFYWNPPTLAHSLNDNVSLTYAPTDAQDKRRQFSIDFIFAIKTTKSNTIFNWNTAFFYSILCTISTHTQMRWTQFTIKRKSEMKSMWTIWFLVVGTVA